MWLEYHPPPTNNLMNTRQLIAAAALLTAQAWIAPARLLAQGNKQGGPARTTVTPGDGMKDAIKKHSDPLPVDQLLDGVLLWKLTPAGAEKTFKFVDFNWLSATIKDRAMVRRRPKDGWPLNLKLLGGTVDFEEANFEFAGEKLARLDISVWNKGDAKDFARRGIVSGSEEAAALYGYQRQMNEAEFKAKIETITKGLDEKLGVKGANRGKDPSSTVKAERVAWMGKETVVQMEYSTSFGQDGFQGEFIRLRLLPPVKGGSVINLASGPGGAVKTGLALSKNVTRAVNGDVYIPNVPMVDQGDKGYCAVASCQRVLNYMGLAMDANELADVTNNRASGGGTNPYAFEIALDRVEEKLKLNFRKLIKWDWKDFDRTCRDYNTVAKKMGRKMFASDELWEGNMGWLYQNFDPEVLKTVRAKNQDAAKFPASVKDSINRGVPLLWALQLGVYKEEPKTPQASGGHMRLIIGYNVKDPAKPQVIFSDSWGAGHEVKRIDMNEAFTVTQGLYVMEPK